MSKKSAPSAGKLSEQINISIKELAQNRAVELSHIKFVKVKSIRPAGRADVYNMTVDSVHNYTVEGGLVLHNCDALRYLIKTMIPKWRLTE